jgi:hypothetical protein
VLNHNLLAFPEEELKLTLAIGGLLMNNLRAAAVGLGLAALLIPGSGHSQIPTFQSQAEVASSLQLVPVDSIPDFGTFLLLSGQLDEQFDRFHQSRVAV